ncbi:LacI family DNA-binding transcriptional regulator [Primorskyibacter aestuariivivens]|uniref:LacI family DNA-binding transcriptional regulator n=1 Tax=Primorskyibacter aestuariivivens TaxID=1888912 RepID=UPI0023017BE4|nr:LacI family DNA-binding transcriptional regulator [Primorskyibacter aestuariivivens]MDA7428973.1 LacI family DNA-binding transcriptional regulator [Primorskyibacter aestuariivivens]
MHHRPTIKDLAQAAGVGTATVDRVLNGRGHVSARMRQEVEAAATRIGFPLPGQGIKARPDLRLGFVLHKSGQAFYQGFAQEIETACARHTSARIVPVIRYAASQSPEDFADAIRIAAEGAHAVAATAVNHPVLSRLTDEFRADGTPLYCLLNDFGGRASAGYFGVDNMKVGRLAGWMMATRLQRPARVGVFVGGTRWHGQALRETGFRAALREFAPHIGITDTMVNLETRAVTYEATLDLLQRHEDFSGLYVAGGGMEGAIAALRDARPAGRVALIVNELTDDSRAALADGYALMVIATPLAALCRALVDRMAAEEPAADAPPLFEPQIYLPPSL